MSSKFTKDDLVSKGAPENSRVITVSNALYALISRHQSKHQNILFEIIKSINLNNPATISLADLDAYLQKPLGTNNSFAILFTQFKTFSQAFILEELYPQLEAIDIANETQPPEAVQTIDLRGLLRPLEINSSYFKNNIYAKSKVQNT